VCCVGVCPTVYELTDDCLAARQRQLALDDEAIQLCNRHQLCYTCVSTHTHVLIPLVAGRIQKRSDCSAECGQTEGDLLEAKFRVTRLKSNVFLLLQVETVAIRPIKILFCSKCNKTH